MDVHPRSVRLGALLVVPVLAVPFAIMVDGPADQWEAALLAAEPVLESVTIGD